MTPSGGILMAPGLAPVPRRVLLALAALCLAWFVLCCVATTRAALPPVPEFPLPVDQQHSTTVRQLAKPVLESHLLDDMKSPTNWHLFGPGEMTFTTERKRDGRQSLRLTSPTKGTEPPPTAGRPWAETGVRREFNNEDWSGFNRLSVWVYPDLPGFKIVSLKLTLDCEGAAGRSYTDGGMNFVLLRNHEWNQVIWEITHLDRKHVKAVELIYRLQGNEPAPPTGFATILTILNCNGSRPIISAAGALRPVRSLIATSVTGRMTRSWLSPRRARKRVSS